MFKFVADLWISVAGFSPGCDYRVFPIARWRSVVQPRAAIENEALGAGPIIIGMLKEMLRKNAAAALVSIIIALLMIGGCSKSEPTGAMARPPSPVLVAKAVVKTVPNQLREIGNVEAFATVQIKSRVEGELVAIHFHEGDMVAKGQLLFSLDSRPFAAALKLAQADLAKDQAQLVKAAADENRYSYLLEASVGSREQ
ncbi:MAG: biotin/lipoyl-binding protein, partial [Deltaproteobacteria bacterium]|nr:biotin/lipoyl-binding protein [Deltaproteobacteria bacterium]